MRKAISVDVLDPESIKAAIKYFEDLQKEMEAKGKEIAKRLALIGMREATVHYTGGIPEGNSDVRVSIRETDTGYAVVAEGRDVYFLEFGAGVDSGSGYDTQEIVPPVDISPGSWSKTHYGPFSRQGYWYYGGKPYTGLEPKKGMYHASKLIKAEIKRVAEEVLNE